MVSYWIDLGLMEYQEALKVQRECVETRIKGSCRQDLFLVTEHPPVFTLGSRGGLESLLVDEAIIRGKGIGLIQTERGGDITFHGPGQLVVYPIFNLKENGLSVHSFIHKLEEVMIRTAGEYGVRAGRDPRNRGVWVGNAKIGSIGIRIRRGVTFHGLALNVNLSLEPFNWINPCGLTGVSVSSMEKEGQRSVDLPRIKWTLYNTLCDVFRVDLMKTEITTVLTDYYATKN